jgi:hypothetical protein
MITVSFKDIAAPVTDEERSNMTGLINNFFQKGHTGAALTVNERGIYVMATLLKESQDTIFEIAKGGV